MQNKNIAELKRKITLVRSADFMLKGFLIMGLIAAESSWQFLLVIGLFLFKAYPILLRANHWQRICRLCKTISEPCRNPAGINVLGADFCAEQGKYTHSH